MYASMYIKYMFEQQVVVQDKRLAANYIERVGRVYEIVWDIMEHYRGTSLNFEC